MDLGNDKVVPSSPTKVTVATTEDARKALNAKNVKYQEQVYWLKLELDTTRAEKRAVEDRLAEAFSTPADTKGTLKSQVALLQASSAEVVASLKEELREIAQAKAQSEMELLNTIGQLESASSTKSDSDLVKQLKAEKAALQDQLISERKQSKVTVSGLRREKSRLTEQVESMQGDLAVLRASVDTIHSIDQMKKNQDESLAALDRAAILYEKANANMNSIQEIMDNHEGEESSTMSTMESASLLQGQVKVALLLIELKLRNTLACLSNDASQISIAVTDPGITKLVQKAQKQAGDDMANLAETVDKQMKQLQARSEKEMDQVTAVIEQKMAEMTELQARQGTLEEDIAKLSVEDLGTWSVTDQTRGNPTTELVVSRKILQRLQTEILNVVKTLKGKQEAIGRLEGTVEEFKVREKTLIVELKRLVSNKSQALLKEGAHASLERLLEEEMEEEVIEEEIIEEEIIEEEIVERGGSNLGVMMEEEEVEEEEDDHKSV